MALKTLLPLATEEIRTGTVLRISRARLCPLRKIYAVRMFPPLIRPRIRKTNKDET